MAQHLPRREIHHGAITELENAEMLVGRQAMHKIKELTVLCESRGIRLEPRAITDVRILAEAEVTNITKIDDTSIRGRTAE